MPSAPRGVSVPIALTGKSGGGARQACSGPPGDSGGSRRTGLPSETPLPFCSLCAVALVGCLLFPLSITKPVSSLQPGCKRGYSDSEPTGTLEPWTLASILLLQDLGALLRSLVTAFHDAPSVRARPRGCPGWVSRGRTQTRLCARCRAKFRASLFGDTALG